MGHHYRYGNCNPFDTTIHGYEHDQRCYGPSIHNDDYAARFRGRTPFKSYGTGGMDYYGDNRGEQNPEEYGYRRHKLNHFDSQDRLESSQAPLSDHDIDEPPASLAGSDITWIGVREHADRRRRGMRNESRPPLRIDVKTPDVSPVRPPKERQERMSRALYEMEGLRARMDECRSMLGDHQAVFDACERITNTEYEQKKRRRKNELEKAVREQFGRMNLQPQDITGQYMAADTEVDGSITDVHTDTRHSLRARAQMEDGATQVMEVAAPPRGDNQSIKEGQNDRQVDREGVKADASKDPHEAKTTDAATQTILSFIPAPPAKRRRHRRGGGKKPRGTQENRRKGAGTEAGPHAKQEVTTMQEAATMQAAAMAGAREAATPGTPQETPKAQRVSTAPRVQDKRSNPARKQNKDAESVKEPRNPDKTLGDNRPVTGGGSRKQADLKSTEKRARLPKRNEQGAKMTRKPGFKYNRKGSPEQPRMAQDDQSFTLSEDDTDGGVLIHTPESKDSLNNNVKKSGADKVKLAGSGSGSDVGVSGSKPLNIADNVAGRPLQQAASANQKRASGNPQGTRRGKPGTLRNTIHQKSGGGSLCNS